MMSRRYGRFSGCIWKMKIISPKNGIMVDKNNHPYLHISETISRVKNTDIKGETQVTYTPIDIRL